MKERDSIFESSVLTRVAFAESALALHFGRFSAESPYRRYIDQAYRDLINSGDLGVPQSAEREGLRSVAGEVLHERVTLLAAGSVESTAEAFDWWHEATCRALMHVYHEAGIAFTVGQAQMWVNLALKYLYVGMALEVESFGSIGTYYRCAHMPLLGGLSIHGASDVCDAPDCPAPVSCHDDYQEYLAIQMSIRQNWGSGLDAAWAARVSDPARDEPLMGGIPSPW